MRRGSIYAAVVLCVAASLTWAETRPKKSREKAATPTPTPAPAFTLPEVAAAPATADSKATVVVFNQAVPESQALARYYAARRGVPETNVIGLKCATSEEITRQEYDRDLAEPLRKIFQERGWWKLRPEDDPTRGRVEASTIHYVALIRGIPLKIAPLREPYPGDSTEGPQQMTSHNEAAVDSELAVLGVYSRKISAGLNNPYFRSYQRFFEASIPAQLLVCRLDAPTPTMAQRMIDDSLAVEEKGLRGMAYIDARGTQDSALIEGDRWMFNAATTLRRKGLPVVLDSGAGLYPTSYPMQHAALYLGWYSEAVTGPFTRPDFRFEPGAIAVHLHSYSASTLRDGSKYWCGPLLAAGAAGTIGNVYEPYLGFTPNLDLFADRLTAGFSFGESAYMCQRLLSWMTTFVGDPLYRPFQKIEFGTTAPVDDEWEAYRRGARKWFEESPAAGAGELRKTAEESHSGLLAEGLGLLQLTSPQAEESLQSFELAASYYSDPGDRVRAALHRVFELRSLKRHIEAVELAGKVIGENPKAPGTELLRELIQQMSETAKAK